MNKIKEFYELKKSVENNVINDDNKVFRHNKTRNVSRVRQRDENNE